MRLDKLVEELGDAITIDWRSFLLRPEPKTSNREKFIEYTKSWLGPAEQEPDAQFTVWASNEPQPTSSMPAQFAAKAVEEVAPELAAAFHRRLLQAYFTENQDISNSDTLLDLAVEVGVDRAELAAISQTDGERLTQAVIDDHNSAVNQGISGVPTVVFEGSFGVPGAQPVETYTRLIERIAEKKAELTTDDSADDTEA